MNESDFSFQQMNADKHNSPLTRPQAYDILKEAGRKITGPRVMVNVSQSISQIAAGSALPESGDQGRPSAPACNLCQRRR